MFRIVCDPSSGSIELYVTEIRSGSLMFFVCLVGVWQRNFWQRNLDQWCVCPVRQAGNYSFSRLIKVIECNNAR